MTIVLAACFNRPYVPHVATMLQSFIASSSTPAQWYLVGDESVDAETMKQLLEFAEGGGLNVTSLRIPDELAAGFEDRPVYPRIAWFRAVLAEALPHEDRLIYLDSDVLALHDLAPLWETALREGHVFAAVAHPSYVVAPAECERLRLPPGAPVLNSGVMVMDLAAMRADGFADHIRAFATSRDRPPLRYADQDAMNVVYAGRWTQLDPVWNAMSPVVMPFVSGASWDDDAHHDPLVLERAARSPAVVHFDGASVLRPWHRRCFNPFAGLYREFRSTTPWPLDGLQERRHDALFARIPARLQAQVWHRRYLRSQRGNQ